MPIAHDSEIITTMTKLANITSSAQGRITSQIQSMGANELSASMGSEQYSAYSATWSDYISDEIGYLAFSAKEFSALTDTEKQFRNLVFAESYFTLYFLSIALKKLVKGSVTTGKEKAGVAEINPSSFDDVISNSELYYNRAMDCISSAFFVNDGDVDSDNSLGFFVV